MNIAVAYIPVLHAGYLEFLDKATKNAEGLYIVDPKWAQTLDPQLEYLKKEIRSLRPPQIQAIVSAFYPKLTVKILGEQNIDDLAKQKDLAIFAPDEDLSHIVIEKFLAKAKVKYSPVFLRWDKKRVEDVQPVKTNLEISQKEFDQKIMGQAFSLAGQSSDWWRHVGAMLIKNSKVLLTAYNTHTPSPQTQYINGDPRVLAKTGEKIEISSSIHAEGVILSEAAKKGIKTQGLDLYVTTFPCPYCARLIAHSGIKKLFFANGYSILDGLDELKRAGVKIIKVTVKPDQAIKQDHRTMVKKHY